MRSRWFMAALALCLLSLAALWGVWRSYDLKRCRAMLAQAREEMNHSRWSTARARLAELLERRPGWDEALYEMGVCEEARGRIQAAGELWAKVPADSPFAGWIEVRRSRHEMDQGRFDSCESLLRSAAARQGPHRAEARWGLVLLLRQEGRLEEAKRWLEAGFDQMSDPVMTLIRLYRLDHDPYPTEGVRRALERAGKLSPDDDRVWLGRAHLATLLGQYDEAERWLDRCRERRPDDVPVWRMRLNWALAASRPQEVRAAMAKIPADQESENRPETLWAWFAAQRGDTETERAALRAALEREPTNSRLLERQAELEIEAGRLENAGRLRRRKTELADLRTKYERRLFSAEARENAAELARLALGLGRRFDARRWAALGGVTLPELAEDAGKPSSPPRREPQTLAALVPEIAGAGSLAGIDSRPVANSTIRFLDDADKAGLSFVQENGGDTGRLIPPVTASGGVGLIDIDNDGWLDVYVVQAGPFPPDPRSPWSGDRLFRNRGDGTFEDVTERSGIAALPRGYGHGVAVGDFDNDGHADLFVTRWRSYALYRNRGDGTFEDATERAGLDGDRDWPTSAAFADLDNDGDLDLYVCHYMKWDENDTRTCADPDDPSVYHCSPIDFPALPDRVFRNDGGRFVDVTAEAGVQDANGRGLGVLAADLDEDGKVDLFVANDMTANYLFRNLGGFRFEETGLLAGVAGNASGGFQAGMGVGGGDLDGDGKLDVAVTNYYNESTSFFRNLGQCFFGEQSAAIGLAAPSRYVLGFGIALFDIDNDGRLDLMTANGHVHDGRPQFPWKMPVQLYHNRSARRTLLADVTAQAGPPFQVTRMGRGLAAGDLDNDGRVDALVVSQNEPLAFFHNGSDAEHFLVLRLEGVQSNRDAVGARVTVHLGDRVLTAHRVGGGSFQSAGDPRLHFGLGAANSADRVEVHWPSGRVDRYSGLKADAGYMLREGDLAPRPMKGRKAGGG